MRLKALIIAGAILLVIVLTAVFARLRTPALALTLTLAPAPSLILSPTSTPTRTSAAPQTAFETEGSPALLSNGSWVVTISDDVLQIAYGSGTNFPQYGALHLNSSYFRLNYGPTSGWGTSVILFPAFWSGGRYYQGAQVSYHSWRIVGRNLALSIAGAIGGLKVSSEINLSPPTMNSIMANITTTVEGDVPLDNRPGEAFKPVMLSSMRISSTHWDARMAFVGCRYFDIPANGWIIPPPFITGSSFGLLGGSSEWKPNAPTIWIALEQPMQVTGWVTPSNDPNDDNVGFWAAVDKVLHLWNLKIIATSGTDISCLFLPLVQK